MVQDLSIGYPLMFQASETVNYIGKVANEAF